MISEHKFAANFSSIWKEVMPLGDGHWAIDNVFLSRLHAPLKNRVEPSSRGLVNELAFMTFERASGGTRMFKRMDVSQTVRECLPDAVAYVNRVSIGRRGHPPLNINPAIDDAMIREAGQVALRLLANFKRPSLLEIRPKFRGCGAVSACEGDLIYENCLYEIKAGDRNFRILDVKQLLVYCALASAAGDLRFSRIGLYNPRTGLHWAAHLDEICKRVSGRRASDLLGTLVEHFSAPRSSA